MVARCTDSGYEVIDDMGFAHVAACSDGQGFRNDLRSPMLAQEHDLALGSNLPNLPRRLQTRLIRAWRCPIRLRQAEAPELNCL